MPEGRVANDINVSAVSFFWESFYGFLYNGLRSRHTNPKAYNIWIRTGIGHNLNLEWYCQCKVGARVFGCCAHVASVLRYLGYWRHSHTQTKTSSLAYTDTPQDAATVWSSDDSATEIEKEI
ncbi:uncharacterized protein TNCT_104251 [Trichonephila clavata]|uniref:SWIM-type domain-containing protein n=1 Tax=Trichonephila clavata TaxID=2740835 RepID=A0A8X6JFW3_TRICU|nr:uncharacterized protein TNCT_104251 [Trichonephila clavata]